MSDYYQVRRRARQLGPLGESSSPIAILPTTEFQLTRIIIVPSRKANGDKVHGQFMKHPALVTVAAFSAGEASARADEIQYNKHVELWGNSGSRPWSGGGSWREVELPGDTQPMALR